MKGTLVSCPTCGTPFVKRTYHHTFCKTLCRIRAFREVHNIPEPNFAEMKRQNIAAKLHSAEMQTRTQLFEYVQRLEHLEQFRPTEIRHLTDAILENPFSTTFFLDNQLSGSARKMRFREIEGKRIRIHISHTDSFLDTQELKEWSYFTEQEQGDYVYFAGKFAQIAVQCKSRHKWQDTSRNSTITIDELEKSRADFLECEEDFILRVLHDKRMIEEEIARLTNANRRRAELFYAPLPLPLPSPQPHSEPISTANTAATSKYTTTQAQKTTLPNIIITTAAELEQQHLPKALPLPKPFARLLGRIPHNPYIILWGDAGSGKTGFTLQFLNALRKHGKALLCTAEASLSGTDSSLVGLARRTHSQDVLLAQTHSIEAVQQIITTKQYPFLAIDSASRLGLTPELVLEWRKQSPETMLLLLMESTKSGNEFKGDNAWKHHCNIMIRAESVLNEHGSRIQGRYIIEKNQYGEYGEMTL